MFIIYLESRCGSTEPENARLLCADSKLSNSIYE